MNFFKKIGGLILLVITIGMILLLFKYLVDGIQKNIPIKNKTEITPTIENKKYLVEKVVDGDTIDVKIDGKIESIRLIGIDAPEKNECYGSEATEKMKELIENKKIKIEADSSQNDKDKYDRLLRYIYLEDGTLINEKLVADGFAKEYTYKIPYKFQSNFKSDQKLAKENKLGLWAVCEKQKAGMCIFFKKIYSDLPVEMNQ